jgi:hypothetical protein
VVEVFLLGAIVREQEKWFRLKRYVPNNLPPRQPDTVPLYPKLSLCYLFSSGVYVDIVVCKGYNVADLDLL